MLSGRTGLKTRLTRLRDHAAGAVAEGRDRARARGQAATTTFTALVAIAGLLAVGLTSATAGSGPSTEASSGASPERIVAGWLPSWSMPNALRSVTATGDLWSEASPFIYQATGARTINTQKITGGHTPADIRDAVKAVGAIVMPTVTETLAAPQMAKALSDPAWRAAHVATLVDLVVANGYDGVDIDYETMHLQATGTPTQREAQRGAVRSGFVALLHELGAALDAKGKLLSVAVGARTSAADPNWAAHDYAGIGAAADRVRIMTYDAHWAGGNPGAIAPLPWVKQVLDYAVSVIPPDRIQVGVPLYGQDWVCGDRLCGRKAPGINATPLTFAKAEAIRIANGAERLWSHTDAAPYFQYVDSKGRKHVVWYSDAQSTAAKMTLVESYGLRGLAFWAAGYEDKEQWDRLRAYAQELARAK